MRINPLQQLSAVQLCMELREGNITSLELVTIYLEHCKKVNSFINAIVFFRDSEAIREAAEADFLFDQWRKECLRRGASFHSSSTKIEEYFFDEVVDKWYAVPPPPWLTGIPCTVKEAFALRGCPQSAGHPKRKNIISSCDAPAVQRLREAGAIPLGVTNLSEMCMWMESSNYVYGVTNNPYDLSRIAGGSSGGEAAAVSGLCAPFGLGSDIGGSIRLPAFFNGVFGHKPSSRLVPNRGQHPGVAAEGHFLLTTGPICRFSQDLFPLLRTLAAGGFLENADHFPPCPMPLAGRSITQLRIFTVEDLGIPLVRVSHDQRAAVRAVSAVLRAAGHKVVDLGVLNREGCDAYSVPCDWLLMKKALLIWSACVSKDPVTFCTLMGDGYKDGFPALVELIKSLLRRSQHTFPAIMLCILEKLTHLASRSAMESIEILGRTLRQSLNDHLGENGVLILPTYPHAAPCHSFPIFWPIQWQYTALFNALELPSTAVPIWLPRSERNIAADLHLPLGVQCVSGWGNDALSIHVATIIEASIGGHRAPFCSE